MALLEIRDLKVSYGFITALKGVVGVDVDAEVLRLRLLLADGSEFL